MRRVFVSLLLIGGVILCVWLGLFLSENSFDEVQRMRELERVPRTLTTAVLPGEANLKGTARPHNDQLIRSPHFGKPCLWYRFLEEEERRDSDGDTYWATVRDDERFVPAFGLEDTAGRIRVVPETRTGFKMRQDDRETRGKRRYTEWRLDPGDVVFMFGYVRRDPAKGLYVSFRDQGRYTPIVSEHGEVSERRGMATASVFSCWGGLVLLSFAVVFVCFLFNVHRLVVYLVFVALTLGAGLTHYGLRMMESDLRQAHDRVERHRNEAAAEFTHAFESAGVAWDQKWESLGALDDAHYAAVPAATRDRLRQIRLDLWRASVRTNAIRDRFPENLFAGSWGIEPEPEIALPEGDGSLAEEAESSFVAAALDGTMALIVGIVALGLGVLLTWLGFRSVKHKRYIENLPTTPTSGAAWGPLETVGTVGLHEADALSGPLSGASCVHYRYIIKERRGSGKNSKWVTIRDDDQRIRFSCTDEEGSISVNPDGAQIYTRHSTRQRRGRQVHTESWLQTGDKLYALGYARVSPEGDALEMQKPDGVAFPFILANIGERAVMLKKARSGLTGLNFAFAAMVLLGLIAFGSAGSFQASDYLAAALIAPFYLAVLFALLMYNDLIFLRHRVTNTMHNIDVALKKRFDLVPQLQSVVKAVMAHEKGLQQRLARLRASRAGSDHLDEAGRVVKTGEDGLAHYNMVIEDYPELKANENASSMMRTLIALENEIAMMRHSYNQAVERYNTKIGHFPELLIAKLCSFRTADVYQAPFEVYKTPTVDLQGGSKGKTETEDAGE